MKKAGSVSLSAALDDIPEFNFDDEPEEKKPKPVGKPMFTNRMVERAKERSKFIQNKQNERYQRINKEEEKIYGKVEKYETQSYKKFKANERLGNAASDGVMQHSINDTVHDREYYEKEKERSEQRSKEIAKDYKEMLDSQEKQRKEEEKRLIKLMQSKTTKQTISDAKLRYLQRKKEHNLSDN